MRIERLFTDGEADLLAAIPVRRMALASDDGTFADLEVRVPADWNQSAVDLLAREVLYAARPAVTKALQEDGVPRWLWRSVPDERALSRLPKAERYVIEDDLLQVVRRMAGAWSYWGWKLGVFDQEEDAKAFYDEIQFLLAAQMSAPDLVQWRNLGLDWAYGAAEAASEPWWQVDPTTGETVPVEDLMGAPLLHSFYLESLEAPLEARAAALLDAGAAVGSDLSALPAGQALGAAKGCDRFAESLGGAGLTRRASRLVSLDFAHPEADRLARWKLEEERKVAAMAAGGRLIAHHLSVVNEAASEDPDPETNPRLAQALREAQCAGVGEHCLNEALAAAREGRRAPETPLFDTAWDSEAYATVSGQNCKVAVKLDDAFVERMLEGDGGNTVPFGPAPRERWAALGEAIWRTGEPSVEFTSALEASNAAPSAGEALSGDPNGSFFFAPDIAAPSGALNLMSFRDGQGGFDLPAYRHAVRLMTLALDLSLSITRCPGKSMAERCFRYRPIALGFGNLGSLLMALGISYESEQGRQLAGGLASLLTGEAAATSGQMAAELGAYPAFSEDREAQLRLLGNLRLASEGSEEGYDGLEIEPRPYLAEHCPFPELTQALAECWEAAENHARVGGLRNAGLTCVTFGQSLQALLDIESPGIEPESSLLRYRRLASGGYLKTIHRAVPEGLAALGYSESEISRIIRHAVGHGTLLNAPAINQDSLRAKGFGPREFERIEAALSGLLDLRHVFNKWVLGEGFCERKLGLSQAQLDDPGFDLLGALGFSAEEIEAATRYCCGHGTLEGAPGLEPHHLSVFDCSAHAVPQERGVTLASQLSMAAAVQSMVTGGVAKIFALHNDATVGACEEILLDAWRLGLKAVSLQRDGALLRQDSGRPLLPAEDDLEDLVAAFLEEGEGRSAQQALLAERIIERVVERPNRRERLPQRRKGYTQKAMVGGHKVYLRTGEYEDGRLGEIFIDMHKEGAAFRSLMNNFAIAISIGLQYGVPLEEFVEAFTFTRFEPAGPVEGNDAIKAATSILDYLFREIAISYLGRRDLANVEPSDLLPDATGKGDAQSDVVRRVASRGYVRSQFTLLQGGAAEAGNAALKLNLERDQDIEAPLGERLYFEIEEEDDLLAETAGSPEAVPAYADVPCSECGNMTLQRGEGFLRCDTCGATKPLREAPGR